MFFLFIAIQYIGIVVLILELWYILQRKNTKLQVILLIVITATLINFVGYLFELQAPDKRMALQAVKFIYLGKPAIVYGTLLFQLQYFRITLPKWLYALLSSFHTAIVLLVLTCDKHKLYYDSVDFVDEGVFPHLVLGHGVIYQVNTVVIVCYFFSLIVIGITRYRRAQNIRERKQILCLIAISVVSMLGLGIFFIGVTGGYDSTLPAYLVSTLLLLYCMLRYDLLDAVTLAQEHVMDEFSDGLLVLDNIDHLVYTNQVVRQIYPELETGRCDSVIDVVREAYQQKKMVERNDRIYYIYQKEIVHDQVSYGQLYVVRDITESHNYTIQLERQTEIANRANQAKSDFLAKMSHEIRTPINAVLGMNEMVLRESRDPQVKQYAMDIKTSANLLLGLINDILDSSKIESGKLELLPVSYELDSLLNDVMHLMYGKAKEKQLQFEIQVEESIPNGLYGDDVRLRQIMVNLLTNAVKYTEEGSVTLSVSATVCGDEARLHCEVSDTGAGIKEEDMPRLFAAFERIEEKKNRQVEGTGLGMSIVIELLNLMDSKLSVRSVYGEGTTFSFEVMQRVVDPEPIGNFEQRSENLYQEYHYEKSFVAPKASVLVVDDNQINRKVFLGLLKETRMHIQEAESGDECLELVQRHHYDLIFMDHMMPGKDGVETLHTLKAMEDSPCRDTPVIALTANAVTGARKRYLDEGFDDFLTKPIQVDKLEQMLIQWLPSEYVTLADSRPDVETVQELPQILEFDFDYAQMHLSDAGLLRQLLVDFYMSIDLEIQELEALFGRISEASDMDEYRIRVHGLKSTAALVGALMISQLARLLEVAAMEEDRSRLSTLHPILIQELGRHRERMRILEQPEEEEKEELEPWALHSMLDMLYMRLDERDVQGADLLMEQIMGYRYEGQMAEDIAQLKSAVYRMNAKEAQSMIRQIEEKVECREETRENEKFDADWEI